ncbi:uncharacterized protein A4U43_C07F3820 [Asparagus officinalis]|uniref:Uncharacterized protein n=1 Tax=Asparagus officinalis TaxID=4686 RepID=A0A5P1E9D5_ASPOF|nr:uncharacterized protein A4U43_C07F3820 [Asparagus officinalis]
MTLGISSVGGAEIGLGFRAPRRRPFQRFERDFGWWGAAAAGDAEVFGVSGSFCGFGYELFDRGFRWKVATCHPVVSWTTPLAVVLLASVDMCGTLGENKTRVHCPRIKAHMVKGHKMDLSFRTERILEWKHDKSFQNGALQIDQLHSL